MASIYKYRIILKSGVSFETHYDHDLYEGFTDELNESLDDNSLIPFYHNNNVVASAVRNEIAAFVLLSSNDNKNTEYLNDNERDKFLSMPFVDLSGMRLGDYAYLPNLTGRVINRIEAIQNAKNGLLALSELLEFRVNDLLEIEFCGKKTVNEITDFLHFMAKHTNLNIALRHHRAERTPFVESILKAMGEKNG